MELVILVVGTSAVLLVWIEVKSSSCCDTTTAGSPLVTANRFF